MGFAILFPCRASWQTAPGGTRKTEMEKIMKNMNAYEILNTASAPAKRVFRAAQGEAKVAASNAMNDKCHRNNGELVARKRANQWFRAAAARYGVSNVALRLIVAGGWTPSDEDL